SASSFCSSLIFVSASLSLSLRHFIPSLVGCRPHGGDVLGLAPRGSPPNASEIASIANAESKSFMISLPIILIHREHTSSAGGQAFIESGGTVSSNGKADLQPPWQPRTK